VNYLLIGVVSASLLACEILLSRLLAVQYWSYCAAMVVSLALSGAVTSDMRPA
jgi:hypothetical protein